MRIKYKYDSENDEKKRAALYDNNIICVYKYIYLLPTAATAAVRGRKEKS